MAVSRETVETQDTKSVVTESVAPLDTSVDPNGLWAAHIAGYST